MEANYSSLILKYTAKLKKNPASSVFAPLAEIYIKMGQHDDALLILKKGLEVNPQSIYGYICLAECYADRGEYDLCSATLAPLVRKFPENLKLQKIYANAAYQTAQYDAALTSYKNILFSNPRDKEVAIQVKKLEDYLNKTPVVKIQGGEVEDASYNTENSYFAVEELDHTNVESTIDEWVQMDISSSETRDTAALGQEVEEYVTPSVKNSEKAEPEASDSFFQTSSMLDIYMGQKLWSKAKSVVDELIRIENDGEKRLEALEILMHKQQIIEEEMNLEATSSISSGDQLMDIFDAKVKKDVSEKISIQATGSVDVIKKAKLLKFLDNIKSRAAQNK